MTCQDHDRAHCPSPRCHVLAVCVAEIPFAGTFDTMRRFARRGDYDLGIRLMADGSMMAHHPHAIAEQIATRLVAWMRWDPSRCDEHPDSCEIGVWDSDPLSPLHDVPFSPVWRPRAEILNTRILRLQGEFRECGCPIRVLTHPLDALSPHHERVKALASECPNPTCEIGPLGKRHHIEEVLSEKASRVSWCDHDGTNWATVAVYLGWLLGQGWSWDTVHEWIEPR